VSDEQASLIEDLARLSADPYKFVLWAFPWGEPTTELETKLGPEPWQESLLKKIRDGLLSPTQAIQIAVASGHGIGKSAFVAWILLWGISTYEDARGVVTANTENQLKTKTWVELNKWHRLFIAKSLFEVTATKLCSRDPAHADTWRIDIVPWSERNTEAFAGMHNKGKRIIVVFDEGSAIPDIIFETTEGALTDSDTQIIWLICGNPTRNTGRFKECFPGGKFAHRWQSIQVDSRDVSITNKGQIDRWIKDYGEDSDFVRIRVRGVFPRAGSLQFIPSNIVDEAAQRELYVHLHDPFIIGVDVARFGDDASVIYFRKGRDGRSISPIVLRGVDTMTLAGKVSQVYLQYRADAVFVDGGGVGGGVVDRLRQLQCPVWDIQFGGKSDQLRTEGDGTIYANKRAEMWGAGKEWLRAGGCIPNDQQFKQELIGPEYGFNGRNEIQLERKEDMKKRGLSSPDIADAFMLTFAYPVIPHSLAGREGIQEPRFESEYNPFDKALETV
jgi:hypothetical protein